MMQLHLVEEVAKKTERREPKVDHFIGEGKTGSKGALRWDRGPDH